jgi:glycosyltransferase involved in cell wall biosynthesis
MNLFYATRLSLPSNTAQSLQIEQMSINFKKLFNFKLISPLTDQNYNQNKFYSWMRLPIFFKKNILKYFEFFIKLVFFLFNKNIDIFYTRDIALIYLIFLYKGKFCYEIHQEPKFFAKIFIKIFATKENFFIVAISYALKEYLLKNFSLDSNRILVAHDGVTIYKYDRLRRFSKNSLRTKLKLPLNQKIIVHTGSLYQGRGIDVFLNILTKINNIYIVFVGGQESEVLNWKNKYIKFNNINFISRKSNFVSIMYQMAADILINPNTIESKIWKYTSPLKIFEYMSTQNPIISTNIGSTAEILNNSNSLKFQYGDDESLINSINLCIKGGSHINLLTSNALKDVRSKFTWSERCQVIKFFLHE